jgi:hypothetical protein
MYNPFREKLLVISVRLAMRQYELELARAYRDKLLKQGVL